MKLGELKGLLEHIEQEHGADTEISIFIDAYGTWDADIHIDYSTDETGKTKIGLC